MTIIELLLLSGALSLDAVVVALGAGALGRLTKQGALYVAFIFGLFQGVMPLLGWAGGLLFQEPLMAYGNLIGFVLLVLVGLKMFKEALARENTEGERNILNTKTLITLAVATSIDALVVGITFTFIPVSLPIAVTTIGFVTFVGCLIGIYIGTKSRNIFGPKIEIVGALVLILLGVKILLG